MYLIILNLLFFHTKLISTEDIDITFGHIWNQRTDTLTIYFDISNISINDYRYYYYDFRPFASLNHREYFPRQRLIDTHNSLNIIGLHENDYISCVSFIDEYEKFYKPRSTCYEFTIGEKIIGSHHRASSGYLMPLLLAFAFVIHVFIAIIHYIKSKGYAHTLLQRFINVNPNSPKPILNVKNSLRQLDQPFLTSSVQRRLSRVSIDTNEYDGNGILTRRSLDESSIYTIPNHNRRISLGVMQTIPEHIP